MILDAAVNPRPQDDALVAEAAALGAFLRSHRERRQIGLQEIAHRTRISVRQLSALERGDIRDWPAGIYRRSMIRAYATAVSLDPLAVTQEFSKVFNENDVSDDVLLRLAEHHRSRRNALQLRLASVRPQPLKAVVRMPAPLACRRSALSVGLSTPTIIYTGAALAILAFLVWYGSSARATSSSFGALVPSTPFRAAHGLEAAASDSPVVADDRDPRLERQPMAISGAPSAKPHAVSVTSGTSIESYSAEPAAELEGELVVRSNPAGARVTVNGIGWGQTPLRIRHVPLGPKRVRLTRDGYLAAELLVQLTPDRPVRAVQMRLQARSR